MSADKTYFGWSKARLQCAFDYHLETRDKWIGYLLYGVILGSAIAVTLRSMPQFSGPIYRVLDALEVIFLTIFVVEYLLRLWSAPNRWKYVFSFWGIVDLAAILPALLFLFPDSETIRTLRLMRMFRLLKLLRMRKALYRFEHALAQSRDELILFSFLASIILFLSAVGIHHFESDTQPEAFGTIPQALWWALVTFTTVGYGDAYPITIAGKVFTALTLIVGLGVVAIPTGIVTSALLNAPKTNEDKTKPDQGRPENEP
ncbi:MAG: ion transporter [Pelagimonas sp.]|nr:ion transporter [Pelagimonas sp.]